MFCFILFSNVKLDHQRFTQPILMENSMIFLNPSFCDLYFLFLVIFSLRNKLRHKAIFWIKLHVSYQKYILPNRGRVLDSELISVQLDHPVNCYNNQKISALDIDYRYNC